LPFDLIHIGATHWHPVEAYAPDWQVAGVAVGLGVGVGVPVGVGDGVGVGVELIGDAVGDGVGDDVGVGVGDAWGVLVAASQTASIGLTDVLLATVVTEGLLNVGSVVPPFIIATVPVGDTYMIFEF